MLCVLHRSLTTRSCFQLCCAHLCIYCIHVFKSIHACTRSRPACLQVLSDPNLKKLYDSGKDVSQDTDFMASGEFFAMLFGSTRFDEFVGELMISTVARSGDTEMPDRAKVRQRLGFAGYLLLFDPQRLVATDLLKGCRGICNGRACHCAPRRPCG